MPRLNLMLKPCMTITMYVCRCGALHLLSTATDHVWIQPHIVRQRGQGGLTISTLCIISVHVRRARWSATINLILYHIMSLKFRIVFKVCIHSLTAEFTNDSNNLTIGEKRDPLRRETRNVLGKYARTVNDPRMNRLLFLF